MLFDNFEQYLDYIGDDFDESEMSIAAVRFNTHGKHYQYFTDNEYLELGDLLIVKINNRVSEVEFMGYSNVDNGALHNLDIVKFVSRKVKINQTKLNGVCDMKVTKIDLKEAATDLFDDAKKIIISTQKGNAILTAMHKALAESGLINDKLTALLNDNKEYVDAVFGVVVQSCARYFTNSATIQKAAHDVNITTAFKVSDRVTFVQDIIEAFISGAVAEIKEEAEEYEKA